LFRAFAQQPGCTGVTLRPGVIVDESRLWNFSLGRALGAGAWLALGPQGPGAEVPLVHVADVAAAVVLALSPGPADGQVLNLVTCPAPERGALLAALSRAPTGPGVAPRRVVRLPWPLHLALARGVSGLNRLLAGRLPLPGLLRPARLQAQFRPLHYSAALAQARLGWRPRWPFLPLPTKAAP
jgi:nucleoside-diphosphate-sugar epimerase